MSDMHNQDYQIRFKRGLAASVNATTTRNLALSGEPHYTTDTAKLYVFDGTLNRRVHGLDMMVTFGGEVVVSSGAAVWSGEY